MTKEVVGVVQEIRAVPRGGRTAYDIVVGGQTYGAGLYPPKCKEGDYIKFEIDDSRGYLNVARNSLKVSKHKPDHAEMSTSAPRAAPRSANIGGAYDTRQDIISRQSAFNTAISFLQVLTANDALGLPKTDTKGKKMEALEAMLYKYAQEFYEQNTGQAWKDISPKTGRVAAEAEEQEAPIVDTSDDPWE